ncbi:uncharacterized protein [Bemisia tabaci]|uniref:uncharacterized protein n=1 Tax=Bemisia tabaci TaxID=7038 RepID=UPI003B287F29
MHRLRQPVRKSCIVSYSYPFSVVRMRFWVLLNLLIFFVACISVTIELGPVENLGAALFQGSRPLLHRMKHVRRSWQRKKGQSGARANNSGSKASQEKLPDGAETSINHTQDNASESSTPSVQQASPVSGTRTKSRVKRVRFQLPPEFISPPPSPPEEEAPSFTMEPGITFVQPEPGVMITTEEKPSLSSFVFLIMPVLGALSYKGRMPFLIRKEALTDPETGKTCNPSIFAATCEWSRRMVWVRRDLRPYSPQRGRLGMGAHEVVDQLAELLMGNVERSKV